MEWSRQNPMQAVIKKLKAASAKGKLSWRQYLLLRERIDSLIETDGGVESLVLPIASECPEILPDLMDIITDVYAEPYLDEKNQEAMLGWVYPFLIEAPASYSQPWSNWVLPVDGREIADFFLEGIKTQFDYIYTWVFPRLYPPHLLLEYWQREDHLVAMQDLADGLESLEPPEMLSLESKTYKHTPFWRTTRDTVLIPRVLLFHVYACNRRDHERLLEMAFPPTKPEDPYDPAIKFQQVFDHVGEMVGELLHKEYPSLKIHPTSSRFLPLGTSYERSLGTSLIHAVAAELDALINKKDVKVVAAVSEKSKEAEVNIEIQRGPETNPIILPFRVYLPERVCSIIKPLESMLNEKGIEFDVTFDGQSPLSRKVTCLDNYDHLRK